MAIVLAVVPHKIITQQQQVSKGISSYIRYIGQIPKSKTMDVRLLMSLNAYPSFE